MRSVLFSRRLAHPDNIILWQTLACLVMTQTLVLNVLTQSTDDWMFLILAWSGAFLVLEHPYPWQAPHPTLFGLWTGFALVVVVLWRSHLIFSLEAIASFLPPIAGLGLVLMAVPLRRIKPFLPSLAILALLPVMRVLMVRLPVQPLTVVNAQLVKAILLIGGLPVQQETNLVTLPGGGVRILEACTGLPTLLQMLLVAIIFAMAFPMLHRWQNGVMVVVSQLFGLLVNSFRLVLLTVITASDFPGKRWWFDQFHTGIPSLLFPGIAMLLFVQVYLIWMEIQVAQLENQ